VVDDDRAVRNSLKFSLEIEGFSVREFAGAKDVLAAIDLPTDGCLIIDYKLPVMDGLQLLRKLRERRVSLPAILITSHPSTDLIGRASAAGVNIIEKPLLGNGLIDAVRKLVDH
jgi:two-component system response regulator FixJ